MNMIIQNAVMDSRIGFYLVGLVEAGLSPAWSYWLIVFKCM